MNTLVFWHAQGTGLPNGPTLVAALIGVGFGLLIAFLYRGIHKRIAYATNSDGTHRFRIGARLERFEFRDIALLIIAACVVIVTMGGIVDYGVQKTNENLASLHKYLDKNYSLNLTDDQIHDLYKSRISHLGVEATINGTKQRIELTDHKATKKQAAGFTVTTEDGKELTQK
jgi:hypothetical protein